MINPLFEIFDLFFPKVCLNCNTTLNVDEELLCIICWSDLPLISMKASEDSSVVKLIKSRIEIEELISLLRYEKGGISQDLLKKLKYRGRSHIGIEFGKYLAREAEKKTFLKSVDVLIPVPIQTAKKISRGYNQSEMIAQGMNEITGIPIRTDVLKRRISKKSQTKKGRSDRWANVNNVFSSNKKAEEFNHILIVDDVLTTGATMEMCYRALRTETSAKISVATLAVVM